MNNLKENFINNLARRIGRYTMPIVGTEGVYLFCREKSPNGQMLSIIEGHFDSLDKVHVYLKIKEKEYVCNEANA